MGQSFIYSENRRGLTRKRTRLLESIVVVCALQTGDALGVVPAEDNFSTTSVMRSIRKRP